MSRGPRTEAVRRDWGDDEDGCGILHVDMDAFFASVELARRPQLRGLPVIVGGSERSVVLAATYEARAFGVHSAMPMAAARRLCPQAVVVPPDHATYHAVSQDVMALLREVTPVVEQVSVDEAYLDVSGARRRLGRPTVIGEAIRARVRERHGITCSVGVASAKFVAKLASSHAKPDGLLLVPRAATVEFLHLLPVGALAGVGERTQEALARWGIRTVRDLAHTDVATVQRAVGRAAGSHLHDLAWGRDGRAVEPGRAEKSIGAETTFPRDVADRSAVEAQLLDLSHTCARRLRSHATVARTVSLKVRTSDFRTLSRSRTLATPTDSAPELYHAARDLFAGVDLGGLPVRLVGVRAEGLSPTATTPRQLTLDEAAAQDGRQSEADQAMDAVRSRFGAGSLRPARLVTAGREVMPSPTTATVSGDLS